MKNSLTDRSFWEKYWSQYSPRVIESLWFDDCMNYFPKMGRLIEIGGFPGEVVAFLNKHHQYDVTILDFYTSEEVVRNIEHAYQLSQESIKVIESDFLKYEPDRRYDIVTSYGFIEHFDDTNFILKKHLDLLESGGFLFVSVPNFTGLNGWIQKTFDPNNYKAHNIDCMNLSFLAETARNLGLKDVEVFYQGKPCIWIEPSAKVGFLVKSLVKIISRLLPAFPRGKWFSPSIILCGTKS